MSVVRTVGKGLVWNTMSSLLGKVIVLVNVAIMLHYLSVYEYGLSELVFSVVTTASIVLLPGLATAIQADINHALARGANAEARAIFDRYTLLGLLLGALLWGIVFWLSTPVAHLVGNISIAFFLKIVSFSFLISPLRMATTMLAQVRLRFADQSLYSVVEELAKGTALAIALIVLGKGVEGVLYATVISQAVAFVLYLPRTISAYAQFGSERLTHPVHFLELVRRHRKWSILGSYFSNITQTAQLWIIRFMLGTQAVGLFAVASGIVSQITALLPLGTVLAPIAPGYAERPDDMRRLLRASLKVQIVLSFGLCLVGIAALPVFVTLFPKYRAAAPLAAVMICTVIPLGVTNVFTPIFAAYKAQFAFFISTFIKFVLIVLTFPLAMYEFGLIGIGVASIITSIVTVIERYARLQRIKPALHIRLRDMVRLAPEERSYVRVLMSRSRLIGTLGSIAGL